MEEKTTSKTEFALCNPDLTPTMTFTTYESLCNWVRKQREKHGRESFGKPCVITITTEIKEIENGCSP